MIEQENLLLKFNPNIDSFQRGEIFYDKFYEKEEFVPQGVLKKKVTGQELTINRKFTDRNWK